MASSSTIPEVPLTFSSKKTIPVVGFGTAEYPFGASARCMKEAILDAIRTGYRHFDTSAVYQSEQYLGQGVKEALSLGLIKSRDVLFITSKLWCSEAHRDCVLPALQKTLKNFYDRASNGQVLVRWLQDVRATLLSTSGVEHHSL
ncbi:hypothetical protein TIFTF001_007538 [Ficus carica]|uniref:NADP-dependent oxidoreductase domain-containing protein n=1 Tax=Ficus carica TaxID=3494 RepID=A0AA87ZQI7_FICCA|nr:hypothetical protein TIFTF001_007538 [Ficus carica]